jgi:hypothetical protein
MNSDDDFLVALYREMQISRVRQVQKYKVTHEDVEAACAFFTSVRNGLTRSKLVEIYGTNTNTTVELLKIYSESLHGYTLDAWRFFDRLDPVNKRKLIRWAQASEPQVRNGNDFFKGIWSYVGVMQLEDIYGDRAQEVIGAWHRAKRGLCCMDAFEFYNALADEDKKMLVSWYNARMDLEY